MDSYFNDDDETILLITDNKATYDIDESTFQVWCSLTKQKIFSVPDECQPNCLIGKYGFKVTYTLTPINIVENTEKCINFLKKM